MRLLTWKCTARLTKGYMDNADKKTIFIRGLDEHCRGCIYQYGSPNDSFPNNRDARIGKAECMDSGDFYSNIANSLLSSASFI